MVLDVVIKCNWRVLATALRLLLFVVPERLLIVWLALALVGKVVC